MLDLKQIFKNEDKYKATYDHELSKYLQKYDLKNCYTFAGVITKDKVKFLPIDTNFFAIINYDTAEKSGSHWVGCIKTNDTIQYFDSYGMIPLKEIKNRYSKYRIEYNDYAIQKLGSNICGHLCISFIEYIVVRKKSYYEFLTKLEKYSIRYKNDNRL
jgi:hypothetical protein